MGTVYLLTLRQLAGRWRLFIMTVLATLPVLVAFVALSSGSAPTVREFERMVFNTMLAGSIIPLVVLAIGGAGFANELEDRTLANLTLSALPRWQIVLPKVLAAFTLAAPFTLASALVTSHIAFLGDLRAVFAASAAMVAAAALYATAFTWLGLVTTQAIGVGLLYIVVWEGFLAGFVEGVRLFSIRYYAIGIMHVLDPRRFAAIDHLHPAVIAAVSVAVLAGFGALAVRRLRRMDVP